jgi:hypothetical protein
VESLFSYKKGWFVYVPIMFFAVLGIGLLRKRIPSFFIPIGVLILLMIYVQSSWWSWWFGGGFGLRAYIDIFGILALPLAATFAYATEHRWRWLNYSYPIVIALLILFHQLNTWQYIKNIIHYNGMNKEAYWNSFLRIKRPPEYWVSLTLPDYTLARKCIYVYYHTGEDPTDLREMGPDAGTVQLLGEIEGDRKLHKEVRRYAGRAGISMDEAMRETAERMYQQMTK